MKYVYKWIFKLTELTEFVKLNCRINGYENCYFIFILFVEVIQSDIQLDALISNNMLRIFCNRLLFYTAYNICWSEFHRSSPQTHYRNQKQLYRQNSKIKLLIFCLFKVQIFLTIWRKSNDMLVRSIYNI